MPRPPWNVRPASGAPWHSGASWSRIYAVPIALLVVLVLVAIVLLAFGYGSTAGALRFLGGGAALLTATLGTAATVGLFWLGQKNDWTSDGPGMLFVMIAIVVCAIVAVLGWLAVFGVAGTLALRNDALPEAPAELKRALRILGFVVLAIAALGQGLTAFVQRGRAAHAAPVVAVSFATARASLFSLDAAGTLVSWDLHAKREAGRRSRPELAGAAEFFVDATGERAFAVARGRALRFAPFGDGPVETVADAGHIARGSAVVVATGRALRFVPYFDGPTPPEREVPWPEPITALAADHGFIAVADRASIALLDGRPRYARTLAAAAAPGAITALEVLPGGRVIALDRTGAGWAIDVRRGEAAPLGETATLLAADQRVFLVGEGGVSEYDPAKDTATRRATVRSGVRSVETWDRLVALGFEDGEVVLGTWTGSLLETERLTAKSPVR